MVGTPRSPPSKPPEAPGLEREQGPGRAGPGPARSRSGPGPLPERPKRKQARQTGTRAGGPARKLESQGWGRGFPRQKAAVQGLKKEDHESPAPREDSERSVAW
jgi:hypothetical protein